MINYTKIQNSTKTTLLNAGAVPVTVRSLTNTIISTVGLFVNGLAKNVDNRQNPTWVTGETARMVMVPGIDFSNAGTNSITTPQVGGSVEWTINAVLYKKVITAVAMEMPVPNTPILFTLGIS
jgi:hypothetical protein